MKALNLLSFPALLILAACGPGRPHVRTLELNREGNKALSAQTYPTAMQKYLEALSYDPFISALHLNLGLSFEGQQQAEQALRSYKEAENLAIKEDNKLLIFSARFNQAQLLAKAKKVDEALALYQRALDVVPTSQETKTNIELLTQGQSGQGGDSDQENKDQNQQGGQSKDQKDKKDQKDPKDQQDQKDPKDGNEEKKEKPPEVQQSAKYKPRPFQGKELSESDVKKILGELKQQEERIRSEYNRQDSKEQPRDKDW